MQFALWQVLAKQVALYTMGESSSLPEYDAHRLLASACFVMGIDPDDPQPDAALVRQIADEGPEAVFERAVARVEREAARTEVLWRDVCLGTPLLESIALKDTLESLRGFPSRYVPRFFAHEVPADIDYPLAQPVPESLQGVDYVNAYLERLLIENRFLQQFDVARCRRLLRAVHPQYGELILNLFEPVAANAVGCVLAGCDVRSLQLDEAGYARIAEGLAGSAPHALARKLEDAANAVCAELAVDDGAARAYVRRLAGQLAPRVATALRCRSLEGFRAASRVERAPGSMFLAASETRASAFEPPQSRSEASRAPDDFTAWKNASTTTAASSSLNRASHSVSTASASWAPSVSPSRYAKSSPATSHENTLCWSIPLAVLLTTCGSMGDSMSRPTTESCGTVRWMRSSSGAQSAGANVPALNPGPSWLYTRSMRRCTAGGALSAAYTARLPPFEWPPTYTRFGARCATACR